MPVTRRIDVPIEYSNMASKLDTEGGFLLPKERKKLDNFLCKTQCIAIGIGQKEKQHENSKIFPTAKFFKNVKIDSFAVPQKEVCTIRNIAKN